MISSLSFLRSSIKKITIISLLAFLSLSAYASKNHTWMKNHPLYIGVLVGYGNTDWSELVPKCSEDDCGALWMAAPSSAGDAGVSTGLTLGYEIQPHFAFEFNFIRFPKTDVHIEYDSNYSRAPLNFTSHTYVFDVVGKFMVRIMNTGIRAFSEAGIAITHRSDILNTFFHANPTFGVGLNYVFSPHWMVDGAFQYIAGYDEANLTPATNYSPFLYSLHLQIAYRF